MVTIHTNLYSSKAKQVLEKYFYHLSTAWSSRMHSVISAASVKRSYDNEVVIDIDDATWAWRGGRGFYISHAPNDILTKFATYLKVAVFKELDSDFIDHSTAWRRGSDRTVKFLSTDDVPVNISEVYFIYDFLKNRKKLENKYSKEFMDEIVGEQLDPIRSEMEKTRQEELAKLDAEFAEFKHQNNPRSYSYSYSKCLAREELEHELQIVRERIYAKYDAIIKEETERYEARKAEINQMADMMNAMAQQKGTYNMTFEHKYWHIASKDGSYLSTRRFHSEHHVKEILEANPKEYPPREYLPVEVTYTWHI